MFDKLQFDSLVTSVLLLPTLIIRTHKVGSSSLDFVFSNSVNYPIHELSISANQREIWEEDAVKNILQL